MSLTTTNKKCYLGEIQLTVLSSGSAERRPETDEMGGGLYIYSKGEWHRSAWTDNDWIWILESANNLWHILNAEKSLLIGKLVTRDLDGRGAPWCELKLFDCLWEESSWKRNPKCHQEFKSGRFTEPLNCGVSQWPDPDQRKALAVHKEMTLTGDANYT